MRWLAWVIRLVAVLALTACSEQHKPPLRVAVAPWPGYEPLLLARDQGIFDTTRVVCFELPTTDVAFEAFRNGSADLAAVTLNQVMEILRSGAKARVLLVMDRSAGGDVALAVPSVRSLADLKGRRVVMPNFSFVDRILLDHMLEEAGLRDRDVTLVPTPEDRFDQVYRRKGGEVFLTFEPYASRLEALGAHRIYDSRRMPDEILDVLMVGETVLQERRQDVCDLARRWFASLDYLERHPAEAHASMARRGRVPLAQFETMWKGLETVSRADNLALLDGSSPGVLRSFETINRYMIRDGKWQQPVDASAGLMPGIGACLE